jgi:hypothetical protein
MTDSSIYGNDSPCCSRTIVQKAVTTNDYGYGSFGGVVSSPRTGGGGEVGFHTRVQGRRGSVTEYSFQIQEASLAVAVEALVLNSDAVNVQLSSVETESSSSSNLRTSFSSERSSKEEPTRGTFSDR